MFLKKISLSLSVLGGAVEVALDLEEAHQRCQKNLQTEDIVKDADDVVDVGGICISDGNADMRLFISLDED